MSDPFIGEIRVVGFDFPPSGWALCDGQTIRIVQNTALFALLGTTFGGDGKTNYRLPDLRGRVVTGQGKSEAIDHKIGQSGTLFSDDPAGAPVDEKLHGVLGLSFCIAMQGNFPPRW